MGYSTKFDGQLDFSHEVTVKELVSLKAMTGIDRRQLDPPQYGDWYYLDLELADNMAGLKWTGAEKSYDMVGQVNYVIDTMRKTWPHFGLAGGMHAQGESADDRWILRIVDGRATKVENPPTGRKVECPECEHSFYI